MPSAFHTFKLIEMSGPNQASQPASASGNPRSQATMNGAQHKQQQQQQQQQQTHQSQQPNGTRTPSSESRMNPPNLSQQYITPQRELRENSVQAPAGTPTRKPRQNLDERDHQLMLKNCLEQRHNFKEGNKAAFWTGVNAAFQQDTGKVLAQMSATVGRLIETRRRQISDWENGVTPQKPMGELNEMLDRWIAFLKEQEPEGEAERMRQVEVKRKVEEARKEARRQALAAEQLTVQQNHQNAIASANMHAVQGEPQQGVLVPVPATATQTENGIEDHDNSSADVDVDGQRPNKRKRRDERSMARDLIHQNGPPAPSQPQTDWQVRETLDQQQQHQQLQPPPAPAPIYPPPQLPLAPHYVVPYQPHPPEQIRRVVVEGALTKDDWRDIMGNDARLRAIEAKMERIELLLSQNNKLLLQLVQQQGQQTKEKERDHTRNERHESAEEDRVPVHLDAEFERDYL